MLNKIQRKILKKLFQEYKKQSESAWLNIADIFRQLNISDGTDVTSLSQSRYFILSGEKIKITEIGISFMEKVYARYEQLAGLIRNMEFVNPDKEERAFVYVEKQISGDEEDQNLLQPSAPPIVGQVIWVWEALNVVFDKWIPQSSLKKRIVFFVFIMMGIVWALYFWVYIPFFSSHDIDSSQVLSEHVFDLVGRMQQLDSSKRKEGFTKEISGMWIPEEYDAYFATTSKKNLFNVSTEISGYSMTAGRSVTLRCIFSNNWLQKISNMEPRIQTISFQGRIDYYDVASEILVLSDCSLLK